MARWLTAPEHKDKEPKEKDSARLLSAQRRWLVARSLPRRRPLCFLGATLPLLLIAGITAAVIPMVTAAPAGPRSSGGHRQVYVLRHCVRSSSDKVKRAKDGMLDPAAYTDRPLPAWGVPPNWCTPTGMDILEGTGADLLRLGGNVSSLRVIADTSMRDGDSALALLRGLAGRGVGSAGGGGFRGAVEFDPVAFDTLEPDVGPALCEAQFTEEHIATTVRERLAKIPYPQPLQEAEAEMEALIGVGSAGPLAALGPPTVRDDGSLHGSVAVLKHFGQMLLYAFASGVPWRNTTREQLYRLIAWQHWFRAVASVHAEKAVANAALLHGVLAALAGPAAGAKGSPGPPPGVTVYFGHDGNLDGLAALLGLQWAAPPYESGEGGALLPTPPGSGLLFDLDEAADLLSVAYVYPTFVSAAPAPLALNTTGVLERAPVLEGGRQFGPTSLESFRQRALAGLQSIPGAADCYERAAARS